MSGTRISDVWPDLGATSLPEGVRHEIAALTSLVWIFWLALRWLRRCLGLISGVLARCRCCFLCSGRSRFCRTCARGGSARLRSRSGNSGCRGVPGTWGGFRCGKGVSRKHRTAYAWSPPGHRLQVRFRRHRNRSEARCRTRRWCGLHARVNDFAFCRSEGCCFLRRGQNCQDHLDGSAWL